MGEVYRARDEKLEREVAIKVLPAELRYDTERLQRFIREAKTASSLKHPNTASIFELGEADGLTFIVMELVEGETLDARIKSNLPVAVEIAELAIQIAGALQEAHSAGIIHRDIKPSNIMVTPAGRVKVLDFGLAKISRQAFTEEEPQKLKTASGAILGTVHYISPEQALGKQIDGRSDLFSLGIVLYEMATGRLPFQGENMVQMIDAILHATPEPPTKFNPRLPASLEQVIMRCLEKDPEDRFASATELIQELHSVKGNLQTLSISKQIAATFGKKRNRNRVTVFVLLVFVLVTYWIYHFGASSSNEAIRSIAVLPFFNSASDPQTEYLADGITEGIIDRLSQVGELKVLARGTVFTYKGKNIDPREVGRALDVDALVTGSVLQQGKNVAIRAELVRAKDGSQIWGQRYNWETSDLPKVQSQIAGEISDQLRFKLSGEQRRKINKNLTSNTEAYQLYLRGRYYWNRRTAAGFNKAIECYQQAIRLDPRFALAYSGLAETYTLMPAYAILRPDDGHPKSKAAAEKALELDPELPEAYTALAHTQHNYDWEWKAAEENYRKAIDLNPNYATAHHWYGNLLSEWGRKEEAIFQKKEALKLDPLSLIINADYGYILYEARDYDAATAQLRKTIDLDPGFVLSYQDLGFVFQAKHQFAEAIAAFQKARELAPESLEIRAQLAQAYALAGDQQQARILLHELLSLSSKEYVASFDIAMIYAGLGETEKAFEWLEKAFEERSYQITALKVEPRLDLIRNEPRFQEMLKLLNIPPS